MLIFEVRWKKYGCEAAILCGCENDGEWRGERNEEVSEANDWMNGADEWAMIFAASELENGTTEFKKMTGLLNFWKRNQDYLK